MNFYNPATGKRSLTSWNHRFNVKYTVKIESFLLLNNLCCIFVLQILFGLLDFKVEHSHFDIDTNNIKEGDTDYSIEVGRQNGINEEKRIFRLGLMVNIKDANNAVNISVEIAGFFEFDSDLDNQAKNNFFMINAPAILFPHVRAYVSALTALSGLKPIILPTINFSAHKNKDD